MGAGGLYAATINVLITELKNEADSDMHTQMP